MRELKFRAWNGSKMLDQTQIGFIPPIISTAPETLDSALKKLVESYSLMQYTGLLDKNGKEIYEGDIVVIIGTQPSQHGVVTYKAPGFVVDGKVLTLNYLWKGSNVKVIGNIYENPELLKG